MQYIPNQYLNNDHNQPASQDTSPFKQNLTSHHAHQQQPVDTTPSTIPTSPISNQHQNQAYYETPRQHIGRQQEHINSSSSSGHTPGERLYPHTSGQQQYPHAYAHTIPRSSSEIFAHSPVIPSGLPASGQHFEGHYSYHHVSPTERSASTFMGKSNNHAHHNQSNGNGTNSNGQHQHGLSNSVNQSPPHSHQAFANGQPPMPLKALHRSVSSQDMGQQNLPAVRVLSVDPALGIGGTQVKVVINISPSPTTPIRSFRVTFGTVDATTRVAFENRSSAIEHVELVATAPRLAGPVQTGRVSLLVQAVDAQEQILATAEAGAFEYVDAASFGYSPAIGGAPSNPRKRFGSPLASDRHNPSRSAIGYGDAYNDQANASPSINQSPQSNAATQFGTPSMPGSALTDRGIFLSPGDRSNSLSNSLASQWGMADSVGPSQQHRGQIMMQDDNNDDGNGLPSSSSLRHPPIPSALEAASQPALLRTSQIPSGLVTAAAADGLPAVAKAQLRLDGDLNTMAMGWSADEWAVRRRLVQFWRVQDNHILNASFRPIRLFDYKPTSIVISCIFRDDKNECFVTSVDAIYLLEALIGVRFTVEEKNRIRRNLEGFKPITISKSKADSEPFFKLIMSFPNPKPRNIEKDVKVFPWKILANALKKIISKYSATHNAPADVIAAQNLDASQSVDMLNESPAITPGLKITDNPMSPGPLSANSLNSNHMSISHASPAIEMGGSGESSSAMAISSHQTRDDIGVESNPRAFDFSSMLSPSFDDQPHHSGGPSNPMLVSQNSDFDLGFPETQRATSHHHPSHARSFSDFGSLSSVKLPDQPNFHPQHQRSRSSAALSWTHQAGGHATDTNSFDTVPNRHSYPYRSTSVGLLDDSNHFSMLAEE